MEISAIHEVEELRALAETTEYANIIELGMMDFDIEPSEYGSPTEETSELSYETCPDHFSNDTEEHSLTTSFELSDEWAHMPDLTPVSNEDASVFCESENGNTAQ